MSAVVYTWSTSAWLKSVVSTYLQKSFGWKTTKLYPFSENVFGLLFSVKIWKHFSKVDRILVFVQNLMFRTWQLNYVKKKIGGGGKKTTLLETIQSIFLGWPFFVLWLPPYWALLEISSLLNTDTCSWVYHHHIIIIPQSNKDNHKD